MAGARARPGIAHTQTGLDRLVPPARSDLTSRPGAVYAATYDMLSRWVIPAVNAGVPAI